MSKGVTHFGAALIVLAITLGWAYFHINSSKIQMHNMAIDFTTLPTKNNNKDTIKSLRIDFCFDSKEISDSTQGKYRNRIRVSYCSAGNSQSKDTGLISLYSIPYLDDLNVGPDEYHVTSPDSDGMKTDTIKTNFLKGLKDDNTYEVKIIPSKNIFRPLSDPREWVEGEQSIDFYSNKLGLIDDCPYYNYYIRIEYPTVPDSILSFGSHTISFVFGDLIFKNGSYFNTSKNIAYNYIFPEPDRINNGYIFYYTKEKLAAVVKNKGIIIQAEDVNQKNKNMSKSIIYAVLVGTGAAFLLDILVQLIRELRNLNRRKEEEEAYQELQKTDVKTDNNKPEEETIEKENE